MGVGWEVKVKEEIKDVEAAVRNKENTGFICRPVLETITKEKTASLERSSREVVFKAGRQI